MSDIEMVPCRFIVCQRTFEIEMIECADKTLPICITLNYLFPRNRLFCRHTLKQHSETNNSSHELTLAPYWEKIYEKANRQVYHVSSPDRYRGVHRLKIEKGLLLSLEILCTRDTGVAVAVIVISAINPLLSN
ncbi:hypothetical protein G9A89_023794 [Geosiphon pyriformis]|nr:hypothetical protein G9A89_023794 [Geosiphon pyriformis]